MAYNVFADGGLQETVRQVFAKLKTLLDGKQTKITASGILKGDGTGGVSAAVAGTDYQTPLVAGTDYATPASAIALGLTGASVGDLVRVSAVDANGVPTAWTPINDPNELPLLREIQLAEDVQYIDLLVNADGYSLKHVKVIVAMPPIADLTGYKAIAIRSNGGLQYHAWIIWQLTSSRWTGLIAEINVHDKYRTSLLSAPAYMRENGRSQGLADQNRAMYMCYGSEYGPLSDNDEPTITNLQLLAPASANYNLAAGTIIRLYGR